MSAIGGNCDPPGCEDHAVLLPLKPLALQRSHCFLAVVPEGSPRFSFLVVFQWLKLTSDDVKEQIYKLAKKGLTPSQIGVILRDSHGVAQVRFVTGNKILRILKSKGLAPDLPEDLYHLIKKAVAVRKHLERNRKDKDAKFRLILIESRIHRLARYYKTRRVLPPTWKYESSTASALVA
ncbi:small ribosomal subunit protein uS15 [Pyxicephalus adspersus]